jgi:hypothetical protein
MSSRTLPIHPKNRDLYGPELYPVESKTNEVYVFVLVYLQLTDAENQNRRADIPKKCGPFSVVSSRYYIEAEFGLWETENGKQISRVAISAAALESLTPKRSKYERAAKSNIKFGSGVSGHNCSRGTQGLVFA